jgi:hypothetical protein
VLLVDAFPGGTSSSEEVLAFRRGACVWLWFSTLAFMARNPSLISPTTNGRLLLELIDLGTEQVERNAPHLGGKDFMGGPKDFQLRLEGVGLGHHCFLLYFASHL